MGSAKLVTGLTTKEAAERLGVNPSRVRQLLAQKVLYGEQLSSGEWIVSAASIAERQRMARKGGRTWKSQTAWSVMSCLVDDEAHTSQQGLLGNRQKRIRNYLAHCDAAELAEKVVTAIPFRRFEAEDPQAVGTELTLSGRSRASRVDRALRDRTDVIEGYTSEECLAGIIRTYALIESEEGNVAIGILPDSQDRKSFEVWTSLIALDMTRSPSTRERSAGLSALASERKRWLRTYT